MTQKTSRITTEQETFFFTLLCPICKKLVTQHHKDDTQTTWYSCEKGHQTSVPIKQSVNSKATNKTQEIDNAHSENNPIILQHINEIENPKYIGKPVTIQAVISSTSTAYTIPSKLEVDLQEEDQENAFITPTIHIDDPINLSLVAISAETKNSRINKHLKINYPHAKIFIRKEQQYREVYAVRVRPPVFTLEKIADKLVDDKGYEYKHLDLYVISDTQLNFQPSTLTKLTGITLPNPKTQKTTLLAYKVEFPEDTLSFDENKLATIQTKFQNKNVSERLKWIIDNFELYSHIVGRQNITKAALLGYFSPLHVELDKQLQRGWAIINIVGDTTTGKSETVKKLSGLLKAGLVISAETASTVGLTGTAQQTERDGWFIDWGFLPLMDRKLLAIDGCHKLGASCWAALAEAERSGVLSITKAAKNNTYARTRQIKIYNPIDREADRYSTKSLGNFLHPIQALTTILDPTSIARIDLCVFSDQRDVTPELINKKITAEPEPELECFSEVIRWSWSGKAKVKWTDEAAALLIDKATDLYKTFFLEAIPLVSIDVKYKIARLSVALAYCTLSTNKDYSMVTVTAEHVQIVIDFLTKEYTNAGLGILAQEHKFEKITAEDVADLILSIQTQLVKNSIENLTDILCFIVTQSRTTNDELKTKFELTENNQARPLIAILKTEGLLTSKRGYYPTPKLIESYKVTEGFTKLPSFNGVNESNGNKKEPLPHNSQNKEQKTFKNKNTSLGVNSVKTAKPNKSVVRQLQLSPSQVCGDCIRFHTDDCQHPSLASGGDPEIIEADSAWACECASWLEYTDSKIDISTPNEEVN